MDSQTTVETKHMLVFDVQLNTTYWAYVVPFNKWIINALFLIIKLIVRMEAQTRKNN